MKLTTTFLKKLIAEEAAKFGKPQDTTDVATDTDEIDADELADSLEKKIDYVKALKIEEARLIKRLNVVKEQRKRALNKLKGLK